MIHYFLLHPSLLLLRWRFFFFFISHLGKYKRLALLYLFHKVNNVMK